jgi:hypothetical protein
MRQPPERSSFGAQIISYFDRFHRLVPSRQERSSTVDFTEQREEGPETYLGRFLGFPSAARLYRLFQTLEGASWHALYLSLPSFDPIRHALQHPG